MNIYISGIGEFLYGEFDMEFGSTKYYSGSIIKYTPEHSQLVNLSNRMLSDMDIVVTDEA